MVLQPSHWDGGGEPGVQRLHCQEAPSGTCVCVCEEGVRRVLAGCHTGGEGGYPPLAPISPAFQL